MVTADYGAVRSADDDRHGQQTSGHEEGSKNQLGVINGVYVPCLLNIIGVVLFLRVGWAISHVGWAGLLGMFAVGETAAILTVLSLSAIVSNGNMKGGGSYYMISRCLGPEFGGSIGLLFYTAYAVGTSFYVIGFATEIVDTFFDLDPDDLEANKMWTTIVASAALAGVMIVSLIGAGFFTRINRFLFLGQFLSILVGIGSMLFAMPQMVRYGEFLGPSFETLMNNTWPDFVPDEKCGGVTCTWALVLGIIFPGVTGISEGANLSGDLKDPASAIGKGTLAAVGTAILTYTVLIFAMSAGFPRETLRHNMSPMQDVAPSKYILIMGIVISTSSSALGSVFGGSRVLQALARDDHPFPGLSFFATGSLHGDEPRRAVVFTWLIAQSCCLIGSLDVISPIISSFFCLSYASVNFCCLVLDLSGTPNFRPRFPYFSRWTSGFGCVLNMALLFFLDVWYAVAAIAALLVLFLWIAYKGEAKSWGDVSQAILFHQVRKYLLRLDERRSHIKYWRPSVLLVTNQVDGPLIDFCNNLKKGGLYVLGSVLVGDVTDLSQVALSLRQSWLDYVAEAKIKALPTVTVSPSARVGIQSLMMCSGLGGMRPNTVVLPFFTRDVSDATTSTTGPSRGTKTTRNNRVAGIADESEYLAVLQDALLLHINVIVACNFSKLDRSLLTEHSALSAAAVSVGTSASASIPTPATSPTNTRPSLQHTFSASQMSPTNGGANSLGEPLLGGANGARGRDNELDQSSSLFGPWPASASQRRWMWGSRSREETTVDVWIVGKWDWEDLNGTLSLQLQMAHIIHANRRWERATKIRIINVVAPPSSSSTPFSSDASIDINTTEEGSHLKSFMAEARTRLLQLKKEVRINCDVKVVLATGVELRARCADGLCEQDSQFESNMPPVHPPNVNTRSFSMLDVNRESSSAEATQAATAAHEASDGNPNPNPTSNGETQEHKRSMFARQMKETNALVREHSAQAKLVLLVLPPMPVATNSAATGTVTSDDSNSNGEHAAEYMSGIDTLLQGLPPTILLAAGQRQNVIPQEL